MVMCRERCLDQAEFFGGFLVPDWRARNIDTLRKADKRRLSLYPPYRFSRRFLLRWP